MATSTELLELKGKLGAIAAMTRLEDELADLDDATPDGWADVLDKIHLLNFAAERATRLAVTAARKDGVTWEVIGAALRMTRQGAQKRYGMELV